MDISATLDGGRKNGEFEIENRNQLSFQNENKLISLIDSKFIGSDE